MSSSKIGGGGPPPGVGQAEEQQPTADKAATGSKAKAGGEAAAADKFERSGATVGAQLQTRLQALQGKAPAAKIQFSNEDIQYLATTFAAILQQNPGADRLKRARLFAKAVLKRKRLKKVFSGVPEAEMEKMCDVIGDVLDSSPIFGQLVDNVTEGADKLNAG